MFSNTRAKCIFVCAMGLFCENVMACSCSFSAYAQNIEETKSIVIKEEPLVKFAGILQGSMTKACTLVRFKIDPSGKAFNAEIVESFPAGRLNRAALKTLALYEFAPDNEDRDQNYYLAFEYLKPLD